MDNEFWLNRWATNNIGFDQARHNQLLEKYFGQLNLALNSRVLVPLCGKSIDMLWLAKQGYEVVGVELSGIACEAFFKQYDIPVTIRKTDSYTVFQSEKITIFAGDFFQLSSVLFGKIDAVYDRAALIALPSSLRQRYVKHLVQLLKPKTPGFLITILYNQDEAFGPPFSVNADEVAALYGNEFDIRPLNEKFSRDIPDSLKIQGLTEAYDQVYFIERK